MASKVDSSGSAGTEVPAVEEQKGWQLSLKWGDDVMANHLSQLSEAIARDNDAKIPIGSWASASGGLGGPVSRRVKHPEHYNKGNIEVIKVIEDWDLNFNLGNVVKYVGRANWKGEAIEDLRKAAEYLNFEIERRLRENE